MNCLNTYITKGFLQNIAANKLIANKMQPIRNEIRFDHYYGIEESGKDRVINNKINVFIDIQKLRN